MPITKTKPETIRLLLSLLLKRDRENKAKWEGSFANGRFILCRTDDNYFSGIAIDTKDAENTLRFMRQFVQVEVHERELTAQPSAESEGK